MKVVGIRELRSNITAIVRETARGESICVARHGQRIAMLVPYSFERISDNVLTVDKDANHLNEGSRNAQSVLVTVVGYAFNQMTRSSFPKLGINVQAQNGVGWHFPLNNLWFGACGQFYDTSENYNVCVLPGLVSAKLRERGIVGLIGHSFYVDICVYDDPWSVFSKLSQS